MTTHTTKQRLLEAGVAMLLERGYNGLGIQDLLRETGIPKGSFYHHFVSKEDFALQAVDRYMVAVHTDLDAALSDRSRPPLERVRAFFENTRDTYVAQGSLGCLLGALGQELSGISEVFRLKIKGCLATIAGRIAVCLEEGRQRGDLPATADPELLANVLVDCWEGAALRMRLVRGTSPLDAVLGFYFGATAARSF